MTASTTATPDQTIKKSPPRGWGGTLRELFINVIVQRRILKKLYPGVMHVMLFWGVSIQILGTILSLLQFELFLPFSVPFPRTSFYLAFELVMDVAGVMILIGGLMAIFRRLVTRPAQLESHWEDWYALTILILLPTLGFITEGLRIQAANPDWRIWSPIGNMVANWISALGIDAQTADAVHQTFFWTHIGTGLVFFASIPFTKLRHLFTGPLNILQRPIRSMGEIEFIENIEEVEKLGAGQIDEFSSNLLLAFNACAQCGRCEEVCPATLSGMQLSPRAVIRDLRDEVQHALVSTNGNGVLALADNVIDTETPWLCTTCGACINICPMFINPVDALLEMRRYATLTTGEIPGPVGEALMGMERRGNPWSMPKESHAPWAKELGVRVLAPGDETDVLLFIGCAFGYDARSQQAGKEFIALLQKADVDFSILGPEEGCCGETARRLGHEYLFQVMAQENITVLDSVKFNRIVTPCAHCFSTLKNEYPQMGGEYEVMHHTELLNALIESQQLVFSANGADITLSYHDSCYLGRYNGIYDQPRELLNSIPEIKTLELDRRGENGFCCGGGGGQMWMETDPDTRINHRRLDEVVENGKTNTVVTACPYCLIMFDDAIRSKAVGDTIQVLDIAEVLSQHL
ncbi:MAG: respiratory nitrate reductase subunit gamma [Anaerolineales bacterium]|nr:respiratory nitrate reductase subunit gamma [Anaerolineales bacterium]